MVEAWITTAECERILRGLRRRLAVLEAWNDGPVKNAAQDVVREEMARVGREMV